MFNLNISLVKVFINIALVTLDSKKAITVAKDCPAFSEITGEGRELLESVNKLLKNLKVNPDNGSRVLNDSSTDPAVGNNDDIHIELSTLAERASTRTEIQSVPQQPQFPPIVGEENAGHTGTGPLNIHPTNRKYLMYLISMPPYPEKDADLLKAGYHICGETTGINGLKQRYSFLTQPISSWPVSEKLLHEADKRLTGLKEDGSPRKHLMVSQCNYN